MEENKSRINKEEDQLRNETTNEVIRNSGNTPNDQSNERSGRSMSDSETERTSTDASDLTSSSNRSGNTDLSNSTATGSGHDTITQRGSNLTTKKGVTGSDFDGQAT